MATSSASSACACAIRPPMRSRRSTALHRLTCPPWIDAWLGARSAAEAGPGQAGQHSGPGEWAEPGRRVGQRLVLVVGELDLRGGDIAFQLLDAGRARYR